MKLKVTKRFKDKNKPSVIYEVGQTVSFDDEERCANLVERGLATPVEEKKASPKKTKKTSK